MAGTMPIGFVLFELTTDFRKTILFSRNADSEIVWRINDGINERR